ncbi:hypothetical protein DL93DRAFT_1401105 [Clavulina sp. PMI_390]|nr:hypothetical protein DL93DRAFT_1401105 [Clavulina sp. PMI_390]
MARTFPSAYAHATAIPNDVLRVDWKEIPFTIVGFGVLLSLSIRAIEYFVLMARSNLKYCFHSLLVQPCIFRLLNDTEDSLHVLDGAMAAFITFSPVLLPLRRPRLDFTPETFEMVARHVVDSSVVTLWSGRCGSVVV